MYAIARPVRNTSGAYQILKDYERLRDAKEHYEPSKLRVFLIRIGKRQDNGYEIDVLYEWGGPEQDWIKAT